MELPHLKVYKLVPFKIFSTKIHTDFKIQAKTKKPSFCHFLKILKIGRDFCYSLFSADHKKIKKRGKLGGGAFGSKSVWKSLCVCVCVCVCESVRVCKSGCASVQ